MISARYSLCVAELKMGRMPGLIYHPAASCLGGDDNDGNASDPGTRGILSACRVDL